MKRRNCAWLFAIILAVSCASFAAEPSVARPEFRAIWVDGFHAGIRTPDEVAKLVADAKAGNFNVLIVQVRRRGDSYYLKSIEPPVEEAPYDPGFDALAYVIELAHKEGIEVHAWMNAMPVWRNAPPPKDPRHVFNQHGPTAKDNDLWLTSSPEGNVLFPVGYFLDPGHPAAAAYLADVYTNVVKNYPDLDGIHFDYIRYPETNESTPSKLGAPVGYNAVSVERFRRATGRTDTPAPDDPQFINWRRQQVTQLVRRVYLQAKEANPRIRVSAALIPWGRPPKDEKDFANTAPMQRIFQDWVGWLKDGILDIAVPMNYARESDAVTRGYWDGWTSFEKRHKHGRQMVIGIGGYLNAPEQIVEQIRRTRTAPQKNTADGISIFSYASIAKPQAAPAVVDVAAPTPAPTPSPVGVQAEFFATSTGANVAPFATAAEIPHNRLIETPTTGWLAGTVRSSSGATIDGANIELRRAGGFPLFKRTLRTVADGNGFFGFTQLKPGRYALKLGGTQVKSNCSVTAGQVARAELVAR